MNDLLFLAHRIPYPPNKGDKIRSYHWIRALACDFRVHLGTFVDDTRDWSAVRELESLCASVKALPLPRALATLRSARGLSSRQPLTLPYYEDRRLHDWVQSVLNDVQPVAFVAYSSSMAQYVPSDCGCRKVLDMVDVDSDKWRQYATRKSWPLNWIYAREARLLGDYERRLVHEFDATLLVSENEADLLRGHSDRDADRVRSVGNGVDLEYFRAERAYANPFEKDRRVMVFTGAMNYWANVEAVRWFALDVLPQVARQVADVQFFIVGANPSLAVRELARDPRVHVTGWVEDTRPFLAHAHFAVAPLRIARGVQNKVLEAMAMARPLLATPAALRGFDGEPVEGVVVASDTSAMIEAAIGLLTQPRAAQLGAAGLRFVSRYHSWRMSEERFMLQVRGAARSSTLTTATA